MAIISLEGIRLYGHHGFYEEEEVLGREFILDVRVLADIEEAADEDELSNSVNYETLYHICQAEFRVPVRLLETLAQRILTRINRQFDNLKGVKVKVRKMNPPLAGRVDEASVEVSSGLFGLPALEVLQLIKAQLDELEDFF